MPSSVRTSIWMFILVFYALLCPPYCSFYLQDFRLSSIRQKRVINGNNVESLVPHMAGIQISSTNEKTGEVTWSLSCGGSIISNDWILTAAHCFYNCVWNWKRQRYFSRIIPIERLRIFHNTSNSLQPNIIENEIKGIHIYNDKFDCNQPMDDIALIQLSSFIPLGNGTEAIELNRDFELQTGEPLRLYGYGIGSNNTLKQANLTVYDLDECVERWAKNGTKVHPREFCSTSNFSDAGRGDSGGGLTIAKNGQVLLAGVVSRGTDQMNENKVDELALPGINTEVRPYIPWIEDKVLDYTTGRDILTIKIRQRYRTTIQQPEVNNGTYPQTDPVTNEAYTIETILLNFSTSTPNGTFSKKEDPEIYRNDTEWKRRIENEIALSNMRCLFMSCLLFRNILLVLLGLIMVTFSISGVFVVKWELHHDRDILGYLSVLHILIICFLIILVEFIAVIFW